MEYRLTEYAIFEAGRLTDREGNPRQEDSIYPEPDRPADWSRLFVVCDGMGGKGAGDVASAIVCRALELTNDNSQPDFTKDDLRKAIVRAYDDLDQADHGQSRAMGTTMAMLRLNTDGAMVAHVGDSRVYHIRPGINGADTKILFRTKDHTHGGEDGAAREGTRKVLTRAMMTKMKRRCAPHVNILRDIRPGDYFFLCTDGMLEYMDDDALCMIFSHDGGNDHNKHGLLLKATANNEDNHSAIIVHILEVIKDMQDDDTYDSNDTNTPTTMGNVLNKMAIPRAGKLLIAFMAVMTLLMIVYSLFIRKDEVLQMAGTAVDKPLTIDGVPAGEETYGYEITAQDIKNEAQQIAPETVEEEPTAEELPSEVEMTENPEASEPEQAPVAPAADEPILQE